MTEASVTLPDTRVVGVRRLAIGLAQGLVLYLMFQAKEHRVWPATDLAAFQTLLLPLLFAPLVAIHGHAHLPARRFAVWLGIVVTVCAAVGFFDGTKNGGALDMARWEPGPLLFAAAAGLFIAETLVLAANAEGRRIASYSAYFDAAWKHGVQVAAAAGFVAALWILLFMGSGLFKLIKLDFLSKLTKEAWFAIPVTAMALAIAIHLTDVHASLVRGIRTLALTLLSWLLPLLVVIVTGFVVSLPFTGIQPLWDTNFAAGLLLAVSAALIVLINAAYQDGLPDTRAHTALRWTMTVGAVLPAPLIAIAGYALMLRVQQYGWTAERVYALACIAVGACYATGYIAAALRRKDLLKPLERTNILTSFVVIGILVLLFTPAADPARIAVSSQMERLEGGRIAPEAFDYKYLRFEGGRYGAAALAKMTAADFKIAGARERAAQAAALKERFSNGPLTKADVALNVSAAGGRPLPESFLAQDWAATTNDKSVYPGCLMRPGERCEAFLLDLNADGNDEIVLMQEGEMGAPVVLRNDGTAWSRAGNLPRRLMCENMRVLLRAGDVRTMPSPWSDLEIGGMRMDMAEDNLFEPMDCATPE